MKIILASASERRQELLKRITDDFEIIVSDFDEHNIEFNGDCAEYVINIAKGKANDVACRYEDEAIVIGSDTVVSYNGKVLGKPKNEDDAFSMLKMLSGNIHQVYSGIALIHKPSMAVKTGFVCTNVKFSEISEERIRKYIRTGEPMDKAGAYGIQGFAGVFVEKIDGCYYNVVGLPLNKLYDMLKGIGVNL